MEQNQKDFIQRVQQKDRKLLLGINVFEKYSDSMKAERECDMEIYTGKDLPIEMVVRLLEMATNALMQRYQQNLNKLQIDKAIEKDKK